MNDFVYSIEGLNAQPGMGGADFAIKLDRKCAVGALDKKIKDFARDRFQKCGRSIIKNLGLEKMRVVKNPYMFYRDTLFIQGCVVPGNACDIAIEGSDFSRFLEDAKDSRITSPVVYGPHNIDNYQQAFALLALWTDWANVARDLVLPRTESDLEKKLDRK